MTTKPRQSSPPKKQLTSSEKWEREELKRMSVAKTSENEGRKLTGFLREILNERTEEEDEEALFFPDASDEKMQQNEEARKVKALVEENERKVKEDSKAPPEFEYEDLLMGHQLGIGTHSETFKVRKQNNDYALKLISCPARTSQAVVSQFHATIWHLTTLKHPNLVKYIGPTTHTPPNLGLIMECYPWDNFFSVIHDKNRDVSWRELVQWSRGIIAALSYLHALTPVVVHGDLRPVNILLAPPGEDCVLKLIDAGLPPQNDLSAEPPLGGATALLAYLSPAVLASPGVRTPADDIYAFGVLLWEMCTRDTPFEALQAKTSTEMAVDFRLHVAVRKERPLIPGRVPSVLADMIIACWDPSLERRPAADVLSMAINQKTLIDSLPKTPIEHTPSLFSRAVRRQQVDLAETPLARLSSLRSSGSGGGQD
jgi:serine/threonine protein kinase